MNSNSEAVWPLLQPTEEVLDSPFGNELKTGDYYDPVSINYPSPDDVGSDVSQQIKEKISETMMGDSTYFKKDGGIISIFDMIKPVNAQR